ncbi:hypothetical protein DMN91_009864 [Ooceraea biroi]|uniref:Integrase catalytic domain-containing protein n=1 Tax=Ooceraea biroi TaxID=2015173 RepID=A0A3L8DCI7_OOCBI|nr:hypothetical protein DMN91_009864 [Ooceraea biroi]
MRVKARGNVSSERLQLVRELHAPARRNFPRRRVIVRGYDDLWQVDLVDVQSYARQNRSYRCILTIINALSKYAWAVPLKHKSGSEVAEALARIFRDDRRCPRNLQTDEGKEFYNAQVRELERKRGINHYSTHSVMKASIVERFNRTLKNEMWKGYTPNWTTEVFKVAKVQRTNPATYLLQDYRCNPISGGFYEHELLRARHPDVYHVEKVLRRRGNDVYVKWLGMDASHNSWISRDNIL